MDSYINDTPVATIIFIFTIVDVTNFGVFKMMLQKYFIFTTFITGTHPEHFHEDIVAGIIGAVDLYLIAVVLLILEVSGSVVCEFEIFQKEQIRTGTYAGYRSGKQL